MSINTRISLVIISAFLLSACGTAKAPTTVNVPPVETGISLRDILGQSQNQVCVYTAPMADEKGVTIGNTTNTIYLSGKKVAQETQTSFLDKKTPDINVRMIFDGKRIYTWDPIKKTPGITFFSAEPFASSDGKTESQNIFMDKKMDIKCSSWAIDESKLSVPKDITFTELSELMKAAPTVPAVPQQ